MDELVLQDATQILGVIQCAEHRDLDAPIVGAAGPPRRTRDVTELLTRVQDDGNRFARICGQGSSDPEIGLLEELDDPARGDVVSRSLEDDGEVSAARLVEAGLDLRFPTPLVASREERLVRRLVLERSIVYRESFRDLALTVEHLTEQVRSFEEPGLQRQRPLQRLACLGE